MGESLKIKLNAYYMVTFRSNAFRAILGWRVVELMKAQRERAQNGIEVQGDIISAYELPEGFMGAE